MALDSFASPELSLKDLSSAREGLITICISLSVKWWEYSEVSHFTLRDFIAISSLERQDSEAKIWWAKKCWLKYFIMMYRTCSCQHPLFDPKQFWFKLMMGLGFVDRKKTNVVLFVSITLCLRYACSCFMIVSAYEWSSWKLSRNVQVIFHLKNIS